MMVSCLFIADIPQLRARREIFHVIFNLGKFRSNSKCDNGEYTDDSRKAFENPFLDG